LGLMIGTISAVIAFIVATIMVLFMLPYFALARGMEWIGGLGALWVLIVPMAVFVIGFIQGYISAALYNIFAPRIGGIKIRFA
jgi:hypothetical protein